MVNCFMTMEPRIYNGEGTVSSINSIEKTEQLQNNETGLLSHTTHKY